MDGLGDIHPGKLKRKARRSASSSSIELPHGAGGLPLGSQDGGASPSLSDLPEVSGLDTSALSPAHADLHADLIDKPAPTIPLDKPAPTVLLDMQVSSGDADGGPVLLKQPEPDPPLSPMEQLDARRRAENGENTGEMSAHGAGVGPSMKKLGSRGARRGRAEAGAQDEAAVQPGALEALIAQARDANAKCLETLAKLQETNAANERRYARWLFVSFAITAIVVIAGSMIIANLRGTAKYNELRFKHEAYVSAVNARAILESEFDKERKGSESAYAVFRLIEDGQFEEAVERFNAVRADFTHPAESALLEQKIDDIKWKLAENAYDEGVMRFNGRNYEQARDAFFKSISHQENTAYTPRLNYYLASSLYNLGDYEGARRYFSRISPSDLNPEMDALARFYRAVSAEKLGEYKEAFEQYDQFLRKYRYHKLADEAVKGRAKVEPAAKK